MITEDYVSFEIAKLLKEKGFNEETRKYYPVKGDATGRLMDGSQYPHNHSQVQICAPTPQMAMKWLREVHDCPIEILWHWDANSQCSDWYFRHHMELKPIPRIEYYDTYEEAAEAAIKYCLENLI